MVKACNVAWRSLGRNHTRITVPSRSEVGADAGISTASRSTVLRTLRVRGAGRGRFASAPCLSLLMYVKYITSLFPRAETKRPPPQ